VHINIWGVCDNINSNSLQKMNNCHLLWNSSKNNDLQVVSKLTMTIGCLPFFSVQMDAVHEFKQRFRFLLRSMVIIFFSEASCGDVKS